MSDDKRDPVTISIVGTGTGDGGGVAPTPSGTVATVEGTQPNLIINVITPVMAILVRFAKTFLVTFVGMLGADGINLVDVGGLGPMVLVSLSASVVDLGKNLITVFGRLEGKFPISTGSI